MTIEFLSADWLNARARNVATQVEALLDHVLFDGILADGRLPFEEPVTKDVVARLTEEQFDRIFATAESAEQRAQLLGMAQALDQDELDVV